MAEPTRALTVHQGARLPALPSGDDHRLMLQMSAALFRSGMLPGHIRNEQAAFAVIQKGYELGVPPMYALSNIVVIGGKPTANAEMMLGLILRDHGDNAVRFVETTAERCTVAYRRRTWTAAETYTFSMEDANRAGLPAGQNANWKKYPQSMLRARCVSAVARMAFADTIGGLHTPEELGAEVAADEHGAVTVVAVPAETRSYDAATGERQEPTPLRAVQPEPPPYVWRWFVDRSIGEGCQATNGSTPCPSVKPRRAMRIGLGDGTYYEASLCPTHALEVAQTDGCPDVRGAPPPVPAEMATPPADNLDALHQEAQTAAEGDFLEVDDDPFERDA